jgi:DNA repair photolyase
MNNYHKKIKTIKKKSNHNKNSIGDLISILNEISNSKTKVKIIILPTLENLNRGKIKKHVLEKINSNQIKVFNMFNNFRTINYEELYFNNAHLNKKGHDYFAKIIYNTIK